MNALKSPPAPKSEESTVRALYIELMKNIVLNKIYGQVEYRPVIGSNFLDRSIAAAFRSLGLHLVRKIIIDEHIRDEGLDWPATAHTMIGKKRLDNLQFCIEDVLANAVPGDLIETGAWRGGATIFMRAVLKAWRITDRRVWVADSFEGLPAPDEGKYPADRGDTFHTCSYLKVSLEEVRENFRKYELLDDQVVFLKGWFSQTLPSAPITSLAVMRLDGDMYESTMDALSALYPRLSAGGYVIIDDYECVPACKQAVRDFREKHGVRDEVRQIDQHAVFWRRTAIEREGGLSNGIA
jgi:O-methyltransferase